MRRLALPHSGARSRNKQSCHALSPAAPAPLSLQGNFNATSLQLLLSFLAEGLCPNSQAKLRQLIHSSEILYKTSAVNESPFTSWPLTSCPSVNPDERPTNESPLTLPLKFLLGFLCPSSFSSYLLPILQEDKHRKNKPWDYWKLLREIEFPGATQSDIKPFLIVCYHNYTAEPLSAKNIKLHLRLPHCTVYCQGCPQWELKASGTCWKWVILLIQQPNPNTQRTYQEPSYVQAGCQHSLRPQLTAESCEESLWSRDPDLAGLSTTCILGICTARRQTFKSSDN